MQYETRYLIAVLKKACPPARSAKSGRPWQLASVGSTGSSLTGRFAGLLTRCDTSRPASDPRALRAYLGICSHDKEQ